MGNMGLDYTPNSHPKETRFDLLLLLKRLLTLTTSCIWHTLTSVSVCIVHWFLGETEAVTCKHTHQAPGLHSEYRLQGVAEKFDLSPYYEHSFAYKAGRHLQLKEQL